MDRVTSATIGTINGTIADPPSGTTYFCGIDVAKHKHVALILDSAGQRVKSAFNVSNSRADFDSLLEHLGALPGPVKVALEATGHYWLALFETLTAAGYEVVVFNPLQVHAYQRSGIRKCKNDRSDAFWIADFLRISEPQSTPQALPTLLRLRELARFRYGLTAQIGDCKRKIICVLDRVFPEYETVFTNIFIASSRRLLQEAVTAQEFAEFDLNELSSLLHRSSRGRLGPVQTHELITHCCLICILGVPVMLGEKNSRLLENIPLSLEHLILASKPG